MEDSIAVARRRQDIVDDVVAGPGASSQRLSERLGVSIDTVQRDLAVLERRGLVRRVRGGAAPISPQSASYADRVLDADDEPKRAMADVAASLIEPGSVVAVTGGTTLTFLADSLAVRASQPEWAPAIATSPVAIFTTNLMAAPRLAAVPGVVVDLPGGGVHAPSRTVAGADTVDAARALRPDRLLISACSLHAREGLTIQHREEAQVIRALVAVARSVVVLVSADRLGSVAPYAACGCDEIDVVITDASAARRRPFADFDLDWKTA